MSFDPLLAHRGIQEPVRGSRKPGTVTLVANVSEVEVRAIRDLGTVTLPIDLN